MCELSGRLFLWFYFYNAGQLDFRGCHGNRFTERTVDWVKVKQMLRPIFMQKNMEMFWTERMENATIVAMVTSPLSYHHEAA